MIIFLDAQGNIVVPSQSEPIGRNSNDAGVIYIAASLPSSVGIYLTFKLPNGITIFGDLADPEEGEEDTRQMASYLFAVPQTSINLWRYKIPARVTEFAGIVQYTIVTVSEDARTTATGTFTVSRGNKITYPDQPTNTAWDNIIAALSRVQSDTDNLRNDTESLRNAVYGEGSDTALDATVPLYDQVNELKTDMTSVKSDTIGLQTSTEWLRADVDELDEFYYDMRDKTATGISASIDPSTFVMRISLTNESVGELGYAEVDLPLEEMIVSGNVSEDGQNIILILKSGESIEFSVANLISGLVSTDVLNGLLKQKLGTDAIVQETGQSTEAVMSQKAVTDALEGKVDTIENSSRTDRAYVSLKESGGLGLVDMSYGPRKDALARYLEITGVDGKLYNVLKTGTPKTYLDAANKEYVDNTYKACMHALGNLVDFVIVSADNGSFDVPTGALPNFFLDNNSAKAYNADGSLAASVNFDNVYYMNAEGVNIGEQYWGYMQESFLTLPEGTAYITTNAGEYAEWEGWDGTTLTLSGKATFQVKVGT